MALKAKLTKAEFDALPDVLKAEYKADGDSYALDVSGLEDTGELRRAKDREAERRREAETTLDTTRRELSELQAKIPNLKDIQTLERSWQGKLDKQAADNAAALAKRDAFIKTNLRDTAAAALAADLAPKHAKLLLPHVLSRLDVDLTGETPVLRVLDGKGQPSASTLEDLGKEFRSNKDFSGIIPVSQASGGGAPAPGVKPGGAPAAAGGEIKPLASMSHADRRAQIDALIAAGKNE